MSTMPPAAEFELTPEDWEAVNAAHLFDSPLYRQAIRNSRIAGGALFTALSLLSLVQGAAATAIVFAVGIVAFPLALSPLQRSAQRRALRKLGEQGIAHGTFGRHRIEVREQGLYHSTHAYESVIRWHAIDDVVEKAGHFFVYTGPNAFIPIPATGFPDSESLRRFGDAFYAQIARHRGERPERIAGPVAQSSGPVEAGSR